MNWSAIIGYGQKEEMKKRYPDRYPSNADSIGIEIVGKAFPSPDPDVKDDVFEPVTDEQNASLKWLVFELTVSLGMPMKDIFRHPVVSYKNPTEAETAEW